MNKKKKNIILVISLIILIALLYHNSLLSFFGAGYKVYANQVTVISENNGYVEYNIPFSILHGNLMGSCSTGTNFDVSFVTYPSPTYFDAREFTGSEMTLPASSPQKNLNIELNREFIGEVSGISANLVWNPCADTTTGVNPIPYVNSVCKVKDYTNDKQNIECSINGYFNGISSNPLPDGTPANTEINGGGLRMTSFSGGTINVKFLKQGIQCLDNSYCSVNETCKNNLCVLDIPIPPIKQPFWSGVLNTIIDWIKKIFDFFFAVTGPATVEPGSIQTYTTELILSSQVDSDWSDGYFTRRYGSMALVSKSGAVIQENTWKEINNTYIDSITITVPQTIDNHAIISVIVEYKGIYNFQTKQWEIDEGTVISKEGINIKTKLPTPPDVVPLWDKITQWIQDLWNWIINLFK